MQFSSPPSEAPSVSRWLRNIWDGISTTLIGMGITIRYFFTKPVTFEYPEQRMPVAPRYRGLHYLEQDICIACRVCEKACPIDCIEIRFERHPGNVNEWFEFSLDYNKCMFCELCCYPCPVDCIHMGREYSLVKFDRSEMVMNLLTWDGLRDLDKAAIQTAIEEKQRKAAEVAAKRAAEKKAKEQAAAKEEPPAAQKPSAEPTAPEPEGEAKPAKKKASPKGKSKKSGKDGKPGQKKGSGPGDEADDR